MTKEVLKVEDLEVGAILTNNKEFTHYNGRTFFRIEEVISDVVYVGMLEKKYFQHVDVADVMPTNNVLRFQTINKQQVLANYKLYNKYDPCVETRWEILVGDVLGCNDKARFCGEFNEYEKPY